MPSSALPSPEAAMAAASGRSLHPEAAGRPSEPRNASRPNRPANAGLVFLVLFATYIIGFPTISPIRDRAAI